MSDSLAQGMGSWPFLIIQTCFIAVWMTLNILAFLKHWDPYPWILLNLLFSIQAAYSAPIIMMSQRRQDQKDRIRSEKDYQVDLHNERLEEAVLSKLDILIERLDDKHV